MSQNYLLAKVWRWHDNPMLKSLGPEDTLYLWEDQFASRSLPFIDLPHPLARFDREAQSNIDSLAQSLKTNVVKLTSLAQLPQNKCKAYYFYDDFYLTSLKGREVEFIHRHPLHFVNEPQALKSITKKSSFTDFRNKLESLRVYEHSSHDDTSSTSKEKAALASLASFMHHQGPTRYLDERNEFEAAQAGTHFSTPLAQGLLSPQKILSELQRFETLHGASKSSYWIKFELLWREFFYYTQHFSTRAIYYPDAQSPAPLPAISLKTLLRDLALEPLMAAMLNELISTGLLSNRCRQIFASFFVHLGKYDWRYGAYLFQYYLRDYDPSSNWGNWQYLAGVGRDPRGLRCFNLKTQQERYNPDGSYVKKWGTKKDYLEGLL